MEGADKAPFAANDVPSQPCSFSLVAIAILLLFMTDGRRLSLTTFSRNTVHRREEENGALL
jgi:hypothetical protein